jgi:hypothetical protein
LQWQLRQQQPLLASGLLDQTINNENIGPLQLAFKTAVVLMLKLPAPISQKTALIFRMTITM